MAFGVLRSVIEVCGVVGQRFVREPNFLETVLAADLTARKRLSEAGFWLTARRPPIFGPPSTRIMGLNASLPKGSPKRVACLGLLLSMTGMIQR